MAGVADAEGEEEEDVAAVAFLVAAAAAAAFRVAVVAVFRGPVEATSPAEAPLGRATPIVRISEGPARGTFPAAEAVVWLTPGTPHRAPELPLASD